MVAKRHTFLFDLHLWRFYVNSLLTRILSNFLFMKHRDQRPFSQNGKNFARISQIDMNRAEY